MRTVVLFPTVEEAKGFLLAEPPVPIFVSGCGSAQTAAAVVRAVKARKPHLVVLAGTAAACDETLLPGQVVEVTSQYEAALPAEERHLWRVDPVTDLPEVAGCSAAAAPSSCLSQTEGAQVLSREGAALMAVCEALGVRCCEIRAISHSAGETPTAEASRSAMDRLTETLNEIFQYHEQEQ